MTLKRAALFQAIAVALILMALGGCTGSNQTAQTTSYDDSEDTMTIEDVVDNGEEGIWIEDANSGEIEEPTWADSDELLDLEDTWTDSVKVFYDKQEEALSYFSVLDSPVKKKKAIGGIGLHETLDNDFPTIKQGSDKRLLLTSPEESDDSIIAYSILSTGYCQNGGVAASPNSYEELDDYSFDDEPYEDGSPWLEFLKDNDCLSLENTGDYWLCSKEQQSFDAGWYEGTSYKEGLLSLERPYVVIDSIAPVTDGNEGDYVSPAKKTATCSIEKTKEGYSIIDISSLKPGLYAMRVSYDSDYCVFYVD